jgi:hypothetical protein
MFQWERRGLEEEEEEEEEEGEIDRCKFLNNALGRAKKVKVKLSLCFN